LIEIGSKTAEKNCTNKQTDRQTDRHYENNGHLAVNQKSILLLTPQGCRWVTKWAWSKWACTGLALHGLALHRRRGRRALSCCDAER